MNSMKRQKDRTLKDELPRLVGAQYTTGDQWRNNSRKNEGMEPEQKQNPAMDVTGDRSKVQCCKDLDYHDIEWLALEMDRDHSVVFEIASKYCISDSFLLTMMATPFLLRGPPEKPICRSGSNS